MNTLYILGGPPRTAKTTIMADVAAEKRIPVIASDAINHGIRNVLTGKPHQMLRRIELHGQAEHKTSVGEGGKMVPFANEGLEADLMLQAVVGMLDYYRKNGSSVAFEGSAFKPGWVAQLNPEKFDVRAAFVGYTDESHADAVLEHAKDNPSDWINTWLQGENGDETPIREWIAKEAGECRKLEADADSHGYPFFDISKVPFTEYMEQVRHYFIEA